jgi:hypothetical protein
MENHHWKIMKVFMCELLLYLILGIDWYSNIILKWLSTDHFYCIVNIRCKYVTDSNDRIFVAHIYCL